jgi:hypothetical protein
MNSSTDHSIAVPSVGQARCPLILTAVNFSAAYVFQHCDVRIHLDHPRGGAAYKDGEKAVPSEKEAISRSRAASVVYA